MKANTKFLLVFEGLPVPELCETVFLHPLSGGVRRCVRGKDAGAYSGASAFPWSKGVQALALIAIEAVIRTKTGDEGLQSEPILWGENGSPAASLDYAIDKRANWLCDMFGCDTKGTPIARRVLARTNASRKRPGPVAFSLNRNFLSPAEIEIVYRGAHVDDISVLLRMRDAIFSVCDLRDLRQNLRVA